MRIKAIHVLDDGTDVWYLVGKPDESDDEWMRATGWGGNITLIVHQVGGGFTQAAISHFSVPEIDLRERGNVDINHTSVGLVEAVKDLGFDDLSELVDLR